MRAQLVVWGVKFGDLVAVERTGITGEFGDDQLRMWVLDVGKTYVTGIDVFQRKQRLNLNNPTLRIIEPNSKEWETWTRIPPDLDPTWLPVTRCGECRGKWGLVAFLYGLCPWCLARKVGDRPDDM